MILYDFLKEHEDEVMMSEEFHPYLKHGLRNILRHRPSTHPPKNLLIIQDIECVDIVEEFETIDIYLETDVFMIDEDELTPPHLQSRLTKYTIEATPWSELLGMQVLGDYSEELTAIKEVLKEMCLFGNTEMTWAVNVARQHLEIEKAVKDFEENPDAKTYTLAEAMEEIFKDFPEHREAWENSCKIHQKLSSEYKNAVKEAFDKNEKRLHCMIQEYVRNKQ